MQSPQAPHHAHTPTHTPTYPARPPLYHLKLSLWHFDRTYAVPVAETEIKRDLHTVAAANEAALDLAKACRGEGEVVMLTRRTQVADDVFLHDEYQVGRWTLGGGFPLDSFFLMDEVQGFVVRNTRDVWVLSGMVRIIEVEEE